MNYTLSWTDKRTFSPADGAGAPAPTSEAAPVEAAAPAETPAPEAAPAPAPAPEAAPAPDLSWLGEEYRGDTGLNFETFRPHYEELLAAEARRAEAPAAPENGEYQFAIPEDLSFEGMDLPEGYAVQIKSDDPAFQPLFGELADFLKANNMPQDAAAGMMGMLAKYEATREAQANAARKAEAAKLGSTPAAQKARLETVKRSVETRLPTEQAKALMAATQSLAGVQALEALLAPRGGQPPVPRPAASDLSGMTAFERLKQINRQHTK